jgi:S-formylglutathione hydrolase FrmB
VGVIRGGRLRLLLVIIGALVACACAYVPAVASANKLETITIPDKAGELPQKWIDYYKGTPRADVLLPDGYNPHKRYPLLVLLSGLNGDYASYAYAGDLVVFNGFPGIVVTPESADGWYTDWWNNGERGSPAWESYELNEVIPAILKRFPILPQRRYHAIAGISMGGLGAPYLGGRLPGFFGSVASLSGFNDIQWFAPITDGAMGLLGQTLQNGDYDAYAVDGPPNGFYATGHNPTAVAVNLQNTRVFQSTGNGQPASEEQSQLNSSNLATYEGYWATEGDIIYPMNKLYHAALLAAGVHVTYDVQPGGHDDPHFREELAAMIKWGLFNPVVSDPAEWTNDTVATSGQLWDVGYRFAQPPDAVVQFHQVGSSLSIGAAGSAVTLTTAGGCTIQTATPAIVSVPSRSCKAPPRKPAKHRRRKRKQRARHRARH